MIISYDHSYYYMIIHIIWSYMPASNSGSLLEAFKTNEMALVCLVDIAALAEKTCKKWEYWADKWRFSFHGEKKVGNDENLKKQVMTRMSWVVRPAHSWTPTMPKMKKTKKQRRRTLPSMGRVSNNSITKILMPFFWETNVNLLLTPSGALYTTVRHYRSPKTSLSPML